MGKTDLPKMQFSSGASKAKANETLTKATIGGYIQREACLTVVNGLNKRIETLESSIRGVSERNRELQGLVDMAKEIINDKVDEIDRLNELLEKAQSGADAEKMRQMQARINELEAERGLYTAEM